MLAGRGVDQLSVDSHPITRPLNTAFQDIANPQFLADLLHLHRLALVSEARVAGDYEKEFEFGKGRDDVVRDPIDEIFLLRITAMLTKGRTAMEGLSGSGWVIRSTEAGSNAGFV